LQHCLSRAPELDVCLLPYFATKLDIAICYTESNISLLLCPERISGDEGSVYPFLLLDEGVPVRDRRLILPCPNDREGVPANFLWARSPFNGAVPTYLYHTL